jgi:cytochrome oxidase Cu insertion factor (SCO1/SenC/PrrC family)
MRSMMLATHLQHITLGVQAAVSSSATSSDETHRAVAETVDSGVSDLELTGGSGIDRPHDRELQDVNIAFFDFVSCAGTSACMTSQCSTRRPFSTRKMSTATIGSGAQPT